MIYKNFFSTFIDNKIYKNIKFIKKPIKFILLAWSLIVIIVFSSLLYLSIPKFFNHLNHKTEIINFLKETYNIEVKQFSKISYKIFPNPRLDIKDSNIGINKPGLSGDFKIISLMLNISQLYKGDYSNFKKIKIYDSNLTLRIKNLENFIKYFSYLKKKLIIKNSNITIFEDKKKLISFKEVNLQNLNYYFKGLFENKKIDIKFFSEVEYNKLTIEIPEIGSFINILFSKSSNLKNYAGKLQSKILNNNFQFDFIKKDKIEIKNSFFRNKNISSSFNGFLDTYPYFNMDINLNIKNIVNKNKLIDFLKKNHKSIFDINKKLNGRININYNSEKAYKEFIKNLNTVLIIENGNLYIKRSKINFIDGSVIFSGEIKSYEDYKVFNFDIHTLINNKNKFIKKLNLDKNFKKIDLKTSGRLNLSSQKINFEKVLINNKYIANEKDLRLFKKTFESLIVNENIFNLFKLEKVEIFLSEVLK